LRAGRQRLGQVLHHILAWASKSSGGSTLPSEAGSDLARAEHELLRTFGRHDVGVVGERLHEIVGLILVIGHGFSPLLKWLLP